MDPELVVVTEPERGLHDAILRHILAFNAERAGPPGSSPFAIAIRDPATGEVSGGLWAVSSYHWLFVDMLIVPEALRGRGIGTRLMRMAEAAARERGCVGVWLDTFQARGFYEKLGYEVFASLDDNPRGWRRFFLRRRLEDAAGGER